MGTSWQEQKDGGRYLLKHCDDLAKMGLKSERFCAKHVHILSRNYHMYYMRRA